MTVYAALGTLGATLVRHRKHEIWRLPNGQNLVLSSTPSDRRIGQNQMRDLYRAMGGKEAVMARIGEIIAAKKGQAEVIQQIREHFTPPKPNGAALAKPEPIPGAIQHSIDNPQQGMYATRACKRCGEVKSVHDYPKFKDGRAVTTCRDCNFVARSDGQKRRKAAEREAAAAAAAEAEKAKAAIEAEQHAKRVARTAKARQAKAAKRAALKQFTEGVDAIVSTPTPKSSIWTRIWGYLRG